MIVFSESSRRNPCAGLFVIEKSPRNDRRLRAESPFCWRVAPYTSISVFVSQSDEYGASEDLQIEGKTPVVSVVEVVLEPVRNRSIAAQPVDLCPSSHTD